MKKRYSPEQIIYALKQVELGETAVESSLAWNRKFGDRSNENSVSETSHICEGW